MAAVKNELMLEAAKQAIAAVAICGTIQLAVFFYSLSYPWADRLVTASFFFIIVFYSAVSEYHARKIKTALNKNL